MRAPFFVCVQSADQYRGAAAAADAQTHQRGVLARKLAMVDGRVKWTTKTLATTLATRRRALLRFSREEPVSSGMSSPWAVCACNFCSLNAPAHPRLPPILCDSSEKEKTNFDCASRPVWRVGNAACSCVIVRCEALFPSRDPSSNQPRSHLDRPAFTNQFEAPPLAFGAAPSRALRAVTLWASSKNSREQARWAVSQAA